MGRPTIYSDELAKTICQRLAEGESLRAICRDEIMPAKSTVLAWCLDSKHPFSDQYARARDIQADTLADELLEIADDGTNDWVEKETRNGSMILCDHEHIQRSRLRVDTRKWIASKLKPKRYGEKLSIAGHDGGPINPTLESKWAETLKDPAKLAAAKLLLESKTDAENKSE